MDPENNSPNEAKKRMMGRFRTIRLISSVVFILTVLALILLVRRGIATSGVQNVRFALLYVFGAVVIGLSIAVVIASHVILRRLKTNQSDEGKRGDEAD